jgi:hypothetical protein
VEISRVCAANFSRFNTLLLIAQFVCNIIFFTHAKIQRKLLGWQENNPSWSFADIAAANLLIFS